MKRTVVILKTLVILCFSFALVDGFDTAEAQTPQQIAKKAFPSVVLLVMEDHNGQPMSLGSGFFVRNGVIASNLHVVEGANRGYVKLIGQKAKFDIKGTVGIDSGRDLILLKISDIPITPLPLGNSDTVEIGEQVYAIGNPQGLEGTFSQGIISSIRQVRENKLLQITAPISPGSSGGPVLNNRGEVIGVAVATFRGGQNLNFAIPSTYLKTLCERVEDLVPLERTKPSKERQSIMSDLGGRGTEGVIGNHFSWNDNRYMGYYTFSVRNNLRQPIRNVVCLVIFYANDGLPIETELVSLEGPIGANLAKRSARFGRINADEVRKITNKTEIRVLDFRLIEY